MRFQFSIFNFQFRPAACEAERGFTLAALIVILSIIAVVTAYSVPKVWSDIRQRERDKQTIWVMKQYARAIAEYTPLHGPPTKLEQLEKQTSPRVLRQTYVNPLSGELDWIMVPEGAVVAPPVTDTNLTQRPDQPPVKPISPRDFSGPFAGVRPPQTGKSFVSLNNQDHYENWIYTTKELREDQARLLGTPTKP